MSKNPVAEILAKETKKKQINPDEIYSKILIYQHKRTQLYTYVFISFCFFLSIVFNHLVANKDWLLMVTPVLVVGAIVCLIPKSEEWEYKAWQSQPRQIERHQVERK